MTTEAEAINHLCVGPKGCGNDFPISRDPGTDDFVSWERRCAGPKCMAWRWAYVNERVLYLNGDSIELLPREKWEGFCGFVPAPHGISQPARFVDGDAGRDV